MRPQDVLTGTVGENPTHRVFQLGKINVLCYFACVVIATGGGKSPPPLLAKPLHGIVKKREVSHIENQLRMNRYVCVCVCGEGGARVLGQGDFWVSFSTHLNSTFPKNKP